MPREGKTGLTIRPSTYQYAKERKEAHNEDVQHDNRVTWSHVIQDGMLDIEEKDMVANNVTVTDTDATSNTIEVDQGIYEAIKDRKESFRLDITWDDIIVHGARRIAGETVGNTVSKEDVGQIVDERIEQRLAPIEQELRALNEQLESNGSDGINEGRARELFFELLKDNVVRNARAPELR